MARVRRCALAHVIHSVADIVMHQISMLRDARTFLIGSKNRKLAARTLDDLKFYAKEQAYTYAVEMAQCFFEDYYRKMSPQLVRWCLLQRVCVPITCTCSAPSSLSS
jgi:hypothetical protein